MCLDLLGPVEVGADTRPGARRSGQRVGPDQLDREVSAQTADKRVGEMLQLIVATREYQFA